MNERSTMARVPFLLLLLALLPGAGVQGQSVRGYILESGSEEPIILADVALLDTAMTVIDRTVSSQEGRFVLRSPEPGSFYVQAGALGYRTRVDGIVELGEGGILPVTFYLVPEPVAVEGFEALAERRRWVQYLRNQGFYERLEAGYGKYITPEEIEDRDIRDFTRLFQLLPEVRTQSNSTRTRIDLRRCHLSGLPPAVYVDGVLVDLRWGKREQQRWMQSQKEGGLEEVVRVLDILAVEVYSSVAQTPLEWQSNRMENTCGTVLIWTKSGE